MIDAANLGGVVAGARGARNAPGLVAFLLPWARERKQVVVVFDGAEQPGVAARLGGIEIVWSGARSADDVIAARLEAARNSAKSWTVVTEDRELGRRCRDLGARVERASIFARRAIRPKDVVKSDRGADSATDKPAPDPREAAHWRTIFGEPDSRK